MLGISGTAVLVKFIGRNKTNATVLPGSPTHICSAANHAAGGIGAFVHGCLAVCFLTEADGAHFLELPLTVLKDNLALNERPGSERALWGVVFRRLDFLPTLIREPWSVKDLKFFMNRNLEEAAEKAAMSAVGDAGEGGRGASVRRGGNKVSMWGGFRVCIYRGVCVYVKRLQSVYI